MNKPSQFIFLTTNKLSKEGQICNTAYGYAISGKDGIGMGQHIYILSDDEIRDNDHVECLSKIYRVSIAEKECLYFNDVATKAYRKDCKKIIATTNPELLNERKKTKLSNTEFSIDVSEYSVRDIPSISQSDIEYIISLHNGKGKEVDVEKLALKKYPRVEDWKQNSDNADKRIIFIETYMQCLQDNADKKFTLVDIKTAYDAGRINEGGTIKSWDKLVKFLTKEQSKTNTVMVEYEKFNTNSVAEAMPLDEWIKASMPKPKLKDGNICISRF